MKKVAIQLYSIRDRMANDVFSTLSEVKKAGFSGVEFAGYFDVAAPDMRRALDERGLVCAGTHTGIQLLGDDTIESTIDYNLTIGNKQIVIPGLPLEMTESYDACIKTCEQFNKIADKLEASGLNLYYHNHYHEFEKRNGKYILDIFMDNSPKLGMELDCYWITYAGVDALDYMKNYGVRCDMLHIKDMLADDNKTCTEVGRGIIDYKAIMSEASHAKWFILEQEAFSIPELESIAISAKFLNEHC